MSVNHYKWLDKHLPGIFEKLGLNWSWNAGIVGAHGDKCYSYKREFEAAGIPFPHGVGVYLLTHVQPYAREVRNTDHGWVDPSEWVIANYHRFSALFPAVDPTDPDVKNLWDL